MYGQDIIYKKVLLDKTNVSLLNTFSCGNEGIDNHIKNDCLNDSSIVTTLCINADTHKPICTYGLSCGCMTMESYNQYYTYPAVEIKLFAMDEAYQNLPYSQDYDDGCLSHIIFSEILNDILNFTDNVFGANLIYLYSTDDGIRFYQRAGFEEFPDMAIRDNSRFIEGCTPMFIRMR